MQMTKSTNKYQLAIAFKQAINKPAERSKVMGIYPELKSAITFYEKNESYFIANAGMGKYEQVVLKALKENMFFQIQEDGPASFDQTTKV